MLISSSNPNGGHQSAFKGRESSCSKARVHAELTCMCIVHSRGRASLVEDVRVFLQVLVAEFVRVLVEALRTL